MRNSHIQDKIVYMLRVLLIILFLTPQIGNTFIEDEDYLEWDEPIEKIKRPTPPVKKTKPVAKKKKDEAAKKEAPRPKAKKTIKASVKVKPKPKPKKIIIALPHNYAPYSYLNKEGKIAGLYIKLLQEINLRMGSKLTFEAMNFEKGMDLSKEGIVGFVGLYKNKKREKIYRFSESIFSESIALYTRTDDTFDFEGFGNLRNKNLGLVKDYSYGDQFDKYKARKFFNFRLGADENELFDLLIQKKVDVILCDDIMANKILFHREIGDKVKKLNRVISNMNIYLVWAKNKAPKNFFKEFNHNLAVIQTNGVYSKILSHFIRTSFMED